MSWRVNFVEGDDGKSVDLDDLSPGVFAEIAKDVDAGLTYWGVYAFPQENPEVLYRVMCAAAEHIGVAPPERSTDMRGERLLHDMFERTEDIAEAPMMDGLPKVPAGTGTGSSSISSAGTTGALLTSEESPSET